MGHAGKSARAAVERDLRVLTGGCPGEVDDDGETCPRLLRFATEGCSGCPLEPVRRPAGFRPCELSVEAARIERLLAAGFTVSMHELSPLVVAAIEERERVLDALRAGHARRPGRQPREQADDEDDDAWPATRPLKVLRGGC